MQSLSRLALAAALSVATLSAQAAALVDRGGGMIYDTVNNITWLVDMNYAQTSGHTGTGVSADGRMTWDAATAWANNLVYGGFSDWRLPTLNPQDTTCSNNFDAGGSIGVQYFGTGCTGGELSHLFVTDLGNKPLESVLIQVGDTAEQIANLALFTNVQSTMATSTSIANWSGTEEATALGVGAWCFDTAGLGQCTDFEARASYAVAVRPGDVAAPVPEPQTLALAPLALGASVVARKRRPV